MLDRCRKACHACDLSPMQLGWLGVRYIGRWRRSRARRLTAQHPKHPHHQRRCARTCMQTVHGGARSASAWAALCGSASSAASPAASAIRRRRSARLTTTVRVLEGATLTVHRDHDPVFCLSRSFCPPVCEDQRPTCAKFAAAGDCDSNREWMHKYCKVRFSNRFHSGFQFRFFFLSPLPPPLPP